MFTLSAGRWPVGGEAQILRVFFVAIKCRDASPKLAEYTDGQAGQARPVCLEAAALPKPLPRSIHIVVLSRDPLAG